MEALATAHVSNLQLTDICFKGPWICMADLLHLFISDSAVSALCDTTGVLTRFNKYACSQGSCWLITITITITYLDLGQRCRVAFSYFELDFLLHNSLLVFTCPLLLPVGWFSDINRPWKLTQVNRTLKHGAYFLLVFWCIYITRSYSSFESYSVARVLRFGWLTIEQFLWFLCRHVGLN